MDNTPDDLTYLNLQEMYASGQLRFDDNQFKPLTIADRINERPFVYNTRPNRASIMQQKVDLNLSGEISPPQLDHQRVQKPIQISDQESSRKPAGG